MILTHVKRFQDSTFNFPSGWWENLRWVSEVWDPTSFNNNVDFVSRDKFISESEKLTQERLSLTPVCSLEQPPRPSLNLSLIAPLSNRSVLEVLREHTFPARVNFALSIIGSTVFF